jgi:hypothetical protein
MANDYPEKGGIYLTFSHHYTMAKWSRLQYMAIHTTCRKNWNSVRVAENKIWFVRYLMCFIPFVWKEFLVETKCVHCAGKKDERSKHTIFKCKQCDLLCCV